ncbi:MAG: flagellar biosynthetic protein FliO [Prevotella sp.]|nr:flagellar biosynthetic protein FliO [Prevotella sp.]
MVGEAFTVICALIGIVGIIFLSMYAAGWLKKRLNGGSFGNLGNAVKIRECVSIAQDKQLMIITVGSKTMLLGVTANSVTKICDLDEEDIAAYEAGEPRAEGGFMQSLKKAFAERNGADAGTENPESKKDGRNEKNDF